VPGRVLEATAYRLTQLSDEARTVLQAAAVAGNIFSVGLVARMLDRSVLSLLGPLEEGTVAGFLVGAISGSRTRWSVRRWRPG
jgi:predicted ATPase